MSELGSFEAEVTQAGMDDKPDLMESSQVMIETLEKFFTAIENIPRKFSSILQRMKNSFYEITGW